MNIKIIFKGYRIVYQVVFLFWEESSEFRKRRGIESGQRPIFQQYFFHSYHLRTGRRVDCKDDETETRNPINSEEVLKFIPFPPLCPPFLTRGNCALVDSNQSKETDTITMKKQERERETEREG